MENNEKKGNLAKTRRSVISESVLSTTISPEFIRSILATSNSIQRIVEQNRKISEHLAKVNIVPAAEHLSSMSEISRIIEAQTRFLDFNKKVALSPAFEQAISASQSIQRLLAIETPRINEIFAKIAHQSILWNEQRLALTKIAEPLQENDALWQSHFLDISKFALLSQTSLSRISWEQVGNALELQTKTQNALKNSFGKFSKAYVSLFDTFENQPNLIMSFPPIISRLPAVEYYNGVSLIDSITIQTETDIEFEEEKQQITSETRKETDDRLLYLLTELNVELIVPLQGARSSLKSSNPDRVRHFATSLRELFTHILHTLAPDDKVEAWSNTSKDYDNGKLTRKARLLYICRPLNHDEFSEFIEKDIASVLAFLQLFQRGTHEIVPKYSDLQLNIMLLRMETTLRFLLEIWRAS
jgi:hypothetical protein